MEAQGGVAPLSRALIGNLSVKTSLSANEHSEILTGTLCASKRTFRKQIEIEETWEAPAFPCSAT